MDADLKARWIAALRSGEYKQGQYQLRTPDNKFCCLGVLCDISGAGEWDGLSYLADGRWGDVVLPVHLGKQIFGFDDHGVPDQGNNPLFRDRNFAPVSLTRMNDDDGLTFDQIADVIEWAF